MAIWTPGWRDGALSPAAREVFVAVARAVLDGVLPADAQVQELALQSHLTRLDASIAGLPPAVRAELSDLLALLSTGPGRLALTGLRPPWRDADVPALQAALQAMRTSDSDTRQQVYQALRTLTNAAWFADAGTWVLLDYPGPSMV